MHEVINFKAGLSRAVVLHFQLLHGLLVVGHGHRNPGGPGVLGKEQNVPPDVLDQVPGSRETRVEHVRHGGKDFGGEGSILVLSILGHKIGIAANAVFPVGAGVASIGLEIGRVFLLDVLEEVGKRRVLQSGVGVFAVPGLGKRGRTRNKIGVLNLSAVDQRRIRFISGPGVGLKKNGEGVANSGNARRHAEKALHLHVMAGIPEENLLPVRPFPPEWRLFVPSTIQEEGRAPVVAGRHPIFDPGAGQD